MAANTVVIYTSDQGFYLGEHGWFDKRFMYDESYRTPLLIRWPGMAKAGAVNSDLVSNLDFAQTFLDIAGVAADPAMQGKSMVPLLEGRRAFHREYHYYHYYEYPGWHMVLRHEGIYDGRYKLIHYYDVDEWELLDLQTDPLELTSVYADPSYGPTVKRMKQALISQKKRLKVSPGIPRQRVIEDPFHYASPRRRAVEARAAESE
jgi:arylsulfatase A-like enzyme